MKILLVQSYLGGAEAPVFPLGLSSLASALQQAGHTVSVLDQNTVADPFGDLEKRVCEFQPDSVGFSIRNIDSTNKRQVVFYYPQAKRAIAAVKALGPAKIIVGGSGFSMFARQIMEDEPLIDYGVYLEGEGSLPALLENLGTPENVSGVYYRREGKVEFTGPAAPRDLAEVALPDRGFVDARPYDVFRDAFGVETKRGCPLSCVYCIYGFLNGRKYRLRKASAVVDDIERLVAQTGAKRFTFVDSIFNVPLSHAEAICREIIRRKLTVPWSAWFSESHLPASFIELLKQAGCDHLIFSPDGFADATLRKLGKKITKAQILAAYPLLRDSGLRVSYNFFKNPPGQSAANFLGMLGFVLKAKFQMRRRVSFEFSSLRIEPHTGLFDIAKEEGVIRGDENFLYPVNYTRRRTRWTEWIFDLGLILKGR